MDKPGLTKKWNKNGQRTVRIMKLESYILGMHIKNTHTHTQMCNNNQMISSMLLIAMVGYSRPKEEVESQGTVETQF